MITITDYSRPERTIPSASRQILYIPSITCISATTPSLVSSFSLLSSCILIMLLTHKLLDFVYIVFKNNISPPAFNDSQCWQQCKCGKQTKRSYKLSISGITPWSTLFVIVSFWKLLAPEKYYFWMAERCSFLFMQSSCSINDIFIHYLSSEKEGLYVIGSCAHEILVRWS